MRGFYHIFIIIGLTCAVAAMLLVNVSHTSVTIEAPKYVHWLKCKDNQWCTLSQLGSMGPDGDVHISSYYNVPGTFYIWVVSDGHAMVISTAHTPSLMDGIDHVLSRVNIANHASTYVTLTEGEPTPGQTPWSP